MTELQKWKNEARELNAEIERLRESYNTAVRLGSDLIAARDAEIERLKKALDQAIRILKYKDPELLDEMKEYGDINFSDFADYLKEKEKQG